MSKQDYIRGFVTKCAEAGLDARQSGFLFKLAEARAEEAQLRKEAEDFYKEAFFSGGDAMDEFRSQQRANNLRYARDLGVEKYLDEDGFADDNKRGTWLGRFWQNHFQDTGSARREIRGDYQTRINQAIERARKAGVKFTPEQEARIERSNRIGNLANRHNSGFTDAERDAAATGRLDILPHQPAQPAPPAPPAPPAQPPQQEANPYANNLYYKFTVGQQRAPLSVGEQINMDTGEIYRTDGRPISGRAQQWNIDMTNAGAQLGGKTTLGQFRQQYYSNAPKVQGAYGSSPAKPAPAPAQPAPPAQPPQQNRFKDTVSYGKGTAATGSNYAP